jgi:transcriptional regulator with XRE-family HTH domain
MSINKRVREARQALKLSQTKFAKGISISNGYIAGLELETRKVNDRLIKLIHAAYGVSENWLKNGEGDMFIHTPDEKLERVKSYFKELNPEFQNYLLKQIDLLLELQSSTNKHED